LNDSCNTLPMAWTENEAFKNEQVQGSLQQCNAFVGALSG
jgi:hypothetical protein